MADLLYSTNEAVLTVGEGVYDRARVAANTIAMTSQLLRISYFTARKTETKVSVRMESGAVAAAATPTLVRVGVWTADDAGALLSQVAATPNDTALLAAATTSYTKAFSASYAQVAGTRYAVGLLVVTGATVPQMPGYSGVLLAASYGTSPRQSGFISAQADLPATAAAGGITNSTARLYFELLP